MFFKNNGINVIECRVGLFSVVFSKFIYGRWLVNSREGFFFDFKKCFIYLVYL